MSNASVAAKIESVENEGDVDFTTADPNTIVTVAINDPANAGKSPSTRFGRIKFDDSGNSELKIALKDMHILHSWGWLSVEDQEKYLGLEQAQPQVIDEKQHNAELAAVQAANVKLAQRNAVLEAQLAEVDASWQKTYGDLCERAKGVEETRRIEVIKLADLTTELEATVKERDALKLLLDAATVPAATVPAATVPAAIAAEDEKKGKKGK